MPRSYYSKNLKEFLNDENNAILGELTKNHSFSLEEQQRDAWRQQILILKEELSEFDSGHILFEYSIPRMGKRVDVVFIYSGLVFIIEFKVNADEYKKGDIDQCLDYALDLKNFHAESHDLQLIPILISTSAPDFENVFEKFDDDIFKPLKDNGKNLKKIINKMFQDFNTTPIDPIKWESSIYKPTPTIIEAAQALYQGHDVKEISRSDAGAENLTRSTDKIKQIILDSKKNRKKSICFLTGVPGSGKTLVGLQLVYTLDKLDEEINGVFLSGNGPLVEVLKHALGKGSQSFVQPVHNFLKEYGGNGNSIPHENIWVYDEAQRAWDSAQVLAKRGHENSEPEDIVKIGDRINSWSVIVALIGEGQSIHIGEEVGLKLWKNAIEKSGKDWRIFCPEKLESTFSELNPVFHNELDLTKTLRSHIAEDVALWVEKLIEEKIKLAREFANEIREQGFVLYITRDLDQAKSYAMGRYEGQNEKRFGLIASAKDKILPAFGVDNDYMTTLRFRGGPWFNDPPNSVKSCCAFNSVATEFQCQGLELDLPIVCWGDDLLWDDGWKIKKTTRRTKAKDPHTLRLNSYRVLLSRGRDGIIIFVPPLEKLDSTYKVLVKSGLKIL